MAMFSKTFYLILEGTIKKISYERRDYESVDEKSFKIIPKFKIYNSHLGT